MNENEKPTTKWIILTNIGHSKERHERVANASVRR